MNDFHHAQKGRSLPGILSTAVAMALSLGFLLSGIRLFQVFGWGLLILVVSGLYSILMGEKWELGVKGSTLYWRYPRWPKSSGSINLELVNTVEINVNTGWISFDINNEFPRSIRLVDGGRQLNDFLRSRFPGLKVDYIEDR